MKRRHLEGVRSTDRKSLAGVAVRLPEPGLGGRLVRVRGRGRCGDGRGLVTVLVLGDGPLPVQDGRADRDGRKNVDAVDSEVALGIHMGGAPVVQLNLGFKKITNQVHGSFLIDDRLH